MPEISGKISMRRFILRGYHWNCDRVRVLVSEHIITNPFRPLVPAFVNHATGNFFLFDGVGDFVTIVNVKFLFLRKAWYIVIFNDSKGTIVLFNDRSRCVHMHLIEFRCPFP